MSPNTVKTERRKKARKRPPSLIYVELASMNGGMMRDLSEEGFALRAMMPVGAGEKTPFSFLLNESVRIEGEGEILWVQEQGRVAGIRFTELASTAREQIRAWLEGALEGSKPQEVPRKSSETSAPTLAQLREEIRSAPQREEVPPVVEAVTIEPAAEVASEEPEIHRSGGLIEPAPPTLPANEAAEILYTPAPEVSSVPAEMPVLTLPREPISVIASSSEPLSPAAPLPDISEILIQPPSLEKRQTANAAGFASLASLEQAPESPAASWTEWFTLSRAIGIMVVLTLAVAMSAYHRAVGEGLIWLGEQMGGTHVKESPTPPIENTTATASPNVVAPQAAEPAPQEHVASSTTSTSDADTKAAGPTGHSPHGSITAAPRSAVSPGAALSGVSNAPSSEASQEAGQTEYVQAMQLLRGKNGSTDSSEAIRLLWVSVEKGNSSAEIALADLYWHGDGVARNCDQTRILLSAAARKGSAAAQKRLQQFQSEGCE